MPRNLHWNDQPRELEDTECVLRFNTDGRILEIAHAHGRWYVTQGNLFGSQTVQCPDVLTAMRLANDVAAAGGRKRKPENLIKLPEGCSLMGNAAAVPT